MAEWYRINAEGTGPAVVYLYGRIGQDWFGDGNASKEFAQELDALSPRDIDLRVNSEGGDVFEGYAIYSALNRYPGRVTAYVDGLAASAASFLIMASNEIVMGEASYLMIHDAWALAAGNAEELREIAQRLDSIDSQMADIYSRRASKSDEDIREAMAAETWFTAQEAVEWGLADRIDESLKAAACISRDAAKLFGSVPDGIDIDDQPLIADTQEVEGTRQEPGLEDDGQEPAAALKAVALSSGRVVYLIRERKDE